MKKRKPSTDLPKEDGQLQKALAILISSTHSRKRPLPLTEIARWLEVAVAKLGSYSAVGDRIGISSKMLRQFSSVRRLARPVQELFESRQIDSVDAAAHLATLSIEDQKAIAHALASHQADTSDIRAVVQLRQAVGKSSGIKNLLKRVKESKSKQEYVAEFIVRGAPNREAILDAFGRHIPATDIVNFELNGVLGRLTLTQAGKQKLGNAARTLGVPLKRVIPIILEGQKRL